MTRAQSDEYRAGTEAMEQQAGRRKPLLLIMLVISIALTVVTRAMVQGQRDVLQPRPRITNHVKGLDSFALGLILGGLRGPLVMYLWPATENQKVEKNLEDIDTRIELIRMLQAEFDSVHIFQIWNKAYNLSVQMSSLANKYATILDAIRYARDVDAERPDNVNILMSLAEVYFQKLGNSSEKRYYIDRVRRETLPPVGAAAARANTDEWKRTHHDAWLDGKGFLLPELLRPRVDLPSKLPDKVKYTGAELQFLERYNNEKEGGFPYGISPTAIAANYYRRASAVVNATGQKHLQMSDSVVDSRAAIALKTWAEEEWELGRRIEGAAFGKPLSEERLAIENLTSDLPIDSKFIAGPIRTKEVFGVDRKQVVDGKVVEVQIPVKDLVLEALFSYRRAGQVGQHAKEEYQRHIANIAFATNADVYRSHMDTVTAVGFMSVADGNYLELMAAANGVRPGLSAAESQSLRESAARNYQDAMDAWRLIMLWYYTDDREAAAVYPQFTGKSGKKLDRASVADADSKTRALMVQAVRDHLKKVNLPDPHIEDTMEYLTYIQRCTDRLKALSK